MKHHPEKRKGISPVLIIEHLSKDFGKPPKVDKKNLKTLTQNEEILLTLIANIIVDIIIKEEL